MSKQVDILELLTDKKKLKKISFDKLSEMQDKYPFCSPLSVLVNRKQFKINGNLSLLQMVDLVSKTDNPGLAFTSVIADVKKDTDIPEKKKRKKHLNTSIKKKKSHAKNKKKKSDDTNLGHGIASEKLAEIYLKQGMKKEAIKMYKSLSLQNPKKSAYFAKILKKIKKQ